MTPRSPDEALHFRGKTLTPESPRPLHVAEPDNIPVLQNQMDPVFNDTSTYETQAFVPECDPQVKQDHHDPRAVPRSQVQQSQHNGEPSLEQQFAATGTEPVGVMGNTGQMQALGDQQHQNHHHNQEQYTGSYHTGSFPGDGLRRMDETNSSAAMSAPSTTTTITTTTAEARNEAARNSSLTALPPSDPASSLTHQPISNRPPPSSNTLPAVNEVDHHMMDWTAQSAASEDRLDTQPHDDNAPNSGEGGVDFQNLLDNLPSSSSAAPSVPAVSETAPSSLQNYASAIPQATVDAEGATDGALQSSTGLPPRPPPQEEPSTHPNYNPSDDIRTYHQLPSQSSNPPPSYPSQQNSNNNQSNNGAPALAAAGAPVTSSGVSSLPPPPGLNIQKTESSGAEPQDSSVLKNGRTEKQAARPPKNGDEDSPWGPEVQRKYDDFLHNERIYVTEGLWDRFPPGSRLFVG